MAELYRVNIWGQIVNFLFTTNLKKLT